MTAKTSSQTKELTEVQKKGEEIAQKYQKCSLEELIRILAPSFNAETGTITTSPCTGKWRGCSDTYIHFNNNVSLWIGTPLTRTAKTKTYQKEQVLIALKRYHPEVIALAKQTALNHLKKQEAIDNASASKKGLKPWKVLTVEFDNGTDPCNSADLGWYYVTLAVGNKIHAHLESNLNYYIKNGKNLTVPADEDKYFVAGALKEEDVDHVFLNVGHSTTKALYTHTLSKEVQERAELELLKRNAASMPKPAPAAQNTAVMQMSLF